MVYFLTVGTPIMAVKVGMLAITQKTTPRSALVRRLSSIQSSNHELVEVLGVVYVTEGEYPTRAAEDLERQLHIEFQHLARFKTGTRGAEWFSSSPELLARLKGIATPPEAFGFPRAVSALIE